MTETPTDTQTQTEPRTESPPHAPRPPRTRSPARAALARALDVTTETLRIYADTPCGSLRYYFPEDTQREQIVELFSYPTLSPRKVELLKGLGVRFLEVSHPDDAKRTAEAAARAQREAEKAARMAAVERKREAKAQAKRERAQARIEAAQKRLDAMIAKAKGEPLPV